MYANAGSEVAAIRRPQKVIHILRAPLGGVMRHVGDLLTAQHDLGLEIGLITASNWGGDAGNRALQSLQMKCSLGIHRIPMDRLPSPRDLVAYRAITQKCRALAPDILHGHGAKGGAFAALAGRSLGSASFYTPHGGSLQFPWTSSIGFLSLSLEKLLQPLFTALIFVCDWERQVYDLKIGIGGKCFRVVHNGLWERDFCPVTPCRDAADLLFIGELRRAKGVDVLLRAMAIMNANMPVTALIVGDGPDRATFEKLADELGLRPRVTFTGALPARSVLDRGRIIVVPSHFESLPYIVLEAAAAAVPLIATKAGGIPEILPPPQIVPPGDPVALARKIATALADIEGWRVRAQAVALEVKDRFSAQRMAREITAFYAQVLTMN